MATIQVLDASGKKLSKRDLAPEVFEAKVSVPLMHQVVVAGLAALRRGTHASKTRGDVSGGGRKPWRQKGTGRARQGSIRAPQWSGGGIAHGPIPRDHSMRVNKKMKRGALRSALTDALASGKLCVVDEVRFDEPRTKRAAEVLEALELSGEVLVVLPGPTDDHAVELSFRNLPFVRMAYAPSLGAYEVLAAERVLLTGGALDVLEGGGRPASAPEATTPDATASPTEEDGS
jgi:large subunit ribosomal protein L4